MDMDSLIKRIRLLNLEVMDLSFKFCELMDNNFFNFDKGIDKEAKRLIEEINSRVLKTYQLVYALHSLLGGSLQDTLDVIWDYDSAKIYEVEDAKLDFEDLVFEDDII